VRRERGVRVMAFYGHFSTTSDSYINLFAHSQKVLARPIGLVSGYRWGKWKFRYSCPNGIIIYVRVLTNSVELAEKSAVGTGEANILWSSVGNIFFKDEDVNTTYGYRAGAYYDLQFQVRSGTSGQTVTLYGMIITE